MGIERVRHFLGYCASGISNVGVVPTCQWAFGTAQLNLKIASPPFLDVRPRFLKHPVKLRAVTSDPFVFRQIMIENEYLPLKDLQVETILDLGANIGLASAGFLNRFPNATVFAVEAEKSNYATCCENLAAYGNRARVLHGAAWSSHTGLTLRRKSCAADNSVQDAGVSNSDEMQVEGYDLPSLLEKSGFAQVDLLKIDIEGAELEVFGADVSNWLPHVRNLCIELHGQACRSAFFRALEGYDFEHVQSGELDICMNLQPKNNA
jgi:FkbM family methyltransferase